jgi:voltage-gated potassium channel
MAILGVVWLGLMVVELVGGLGPLGTTAVTVIWAAFIVDFLLRLTLAPRKLVYLRRNWLTAIALLLPALRMFRVLSRLRGIQLVRILSSINRGMKALGKTMRRRGFGYALGLTTIVTVAGAAGMMFFERQSGASPLFQDFWSALWWTAMIVTTMGSEGWPLTPEGRALSLFLAIYAFAVFGYVTGTIATYFIGRDAADEHAEVAGRESVDRLRGEIAALREEIRALRERGS